MKISASLPTSKQLEKKLEHDPLRNLKERKQCETLTALEFVTDLQERMLWSRFEPRVAESVVERLILFPQKLNLDLLVKALATTTWPWAWVALFDFARVLCPSSHPVHQAWRHLFLEAKQLQAKLEFQAFYIDWYGAGGRLTQRALNNTLRPWERSGFWALSAPHSKELLEHCRKLGYLTSKTFAIPLSARALENKIKDLFQNNHQWLSLAQIDEQLQSGMSQRQLLRILQTHNNFHSTGQLKGTRYRFVNSSEKLNRQA